MDLSQLEVLVAVAEERSFSRAAERLRRTQSAVSQAVRRLEAEIGTPLFDRSSRGGTLTEAGRVLEEYAQQMLNLRRAARSAVQELENLQSGKVSLAVNEYTVMHLLPALAAFRARHPHVKVEVRRSPARDIPSAVLGRDVELGVLTYRPVHRDLSVLPIAHDDVALLVPPLHPLARRAEVSVKELGVETFLAHAVPSPYRERVVQAFERHRTPLNIGMELPTLEAIKRLVEIGLGVALMPRRAAHAEIARGDLVAIPVREMRLQRTVHLVFRGSAALSHAARAFVACARETARPEPAGASPGPGARPASRAARPR